MLSVTLLVKLDLLIECRDAACEWMHSNEAFIMPQIVETVLNMPATAHVGVMQTAVTLLGQLGPWLNKRRSQPYLGNISTEFQLPYTLTGWAKKTRPLCILPDI